MAKITGIGGVFFKSTGDHKKLSEWYASNLGLQLEDWGGAILKWSDDTANDEGLTVWNVAASDTRWFQPSSASFMINYRVDSLDGMLAQLKANGIEPVKGPESAENGKFAWILDPDGNKVELWEPMLWDDKNKAEGDYLVIDTFDDEAFTILSNIPDQESYWDCDQEWERVD